jgi:hypothetical protein
LGVEKKKFITLLELLVLDLVIVPSLCSLFVELGTMICLLLLLAITSGLLHIHVLAFYGPVSSMLKLN